MEIAKKTVLDSDTFDQIRLFFINNYYENKVENEEEYAINPNIELITPLKVHKNFRNLCSSLVMAMTVIYFKPGDPVIV